MELIRLDEYSVIAKDIEGHNYIIHWNEDEMASIHGTIEEYIKTNGHEIGNYIEEEK